MLPHGAVDWTAQRWQSVAKDSQRQMALEALHLLTARVHNVLSKPLGSTSPRTRSCSILP